MNTHHKTSAILSSTYQKFLKLMDIWRSSDTNSLCSFFRHCVNTIPSVWWSKWRKGRYYSNNYLDSNIITVIIIFVKYHLIVQRGW